MRRVGFVSIILALALIFSTVGTVFAQSPETTPPPPTEDPVVVPTPDPTVAPVSINPIVKLLAQFFSLLFTVPVPTETSPPTDTTTPPADGTTVPTDVTTTPTPVPLTPEEQVAAYHDQGLGFGVLVKLFSIASAAAEECKLTGNLCDVTVDSLIAQFQGGMGIGQLEKVYGKPEFLGVGHVRNNQGNGNGKGNGNGNGKNKP